MLLGKRKEALDALFAARSECDNVYADAKILYISEDVDAFRDRVDSILKSEFDVSSEDADAICELKPVYYTIAVENILIGAYYDEGFRKEEPEEIKPEEDKPEEKILPELDDVLPEEQSILDNMEN